MLLRNFEKSNKNDDLVKGVKLFEENPHYAIMKDQRRITKTVSVQDLAPYPKKDVQNSVEVQLKNSDELTMEAANSDPRVSVPCLLLPDNILNSSKPSDQDVRFDESSSRPVTDIVKKS